MVVLFSLTLFLSAALLFAVQPLIAKLVLPLLGSTPAVWTASLMFFQAALLAGYVYAHATSAGLGARRAATVHLALLPLPLLVLPLGLPDGWTPPAQANPVGWLLTLLLVSVGLPFFVVSATAPLLQRWLAATSHPAARDPYFLYRASNVGAMVGLLGYPIAMEPSLRLADQGRLWSAGYLALATLIAACAIALWRSPAALARTGEGAPSAAEPTGARGAPTAARRARWVALAFVPSSLVLGVTSFLTTDVAPIPLLWALPLALYLGSFVLVFSPRPGAGERGRTAAAVLPAATALVAFTLLTRMRQPLELLVALHLGAFFVAAVACHGELARDRPASAHLTEFYLWVAVGGVLGGAFNALLAPVLFDSLVEYPAAIVAALLLRPRDGQGQESRLERYGDLGLPLALGAGLAAGLHLLELADGLTEAVLSFWLLVGALGVCLVLFRSRPIRFGLGLAAVLIGGASAFRPPETTLHQERSFFGVYRVAAAAGPQHRLLHGTTLHGAQTRDGRRPPRTGTYYHPSGPIGQALDALAERGVTRRAAVVGLGAGTIACHARRGERWTFYEVDPTVERIARDPRLFTYLRDCPGSFDVVIGDGRLGIARARPAEFGLIVADAFSSDAIPVHLLTREALALYRSRLAPDGVIALHITNRYLDLGGVLGSMAAAERLACLIQSEDPAEAARVPGKVASDWVLIARRPGHFGRLAGDRRWRRCPRDGQAWTDDFSNVLGPLAARRAQQRSEQGGATIPFSWARIG